MSIHMKQTNPKLIYHLRHHPKALDLIDLPPLYNDAGRLHEDVARLARAGLVAIAGSAVMWRGS